jgi:hypothetical protein
VPDELKAYPLYFSKNSNKSIEAMPYAAIGDSTGI